jgi:hypothetical protein
MMEILVALAVIGLLFLALLTHGVRVPGHRHQEESLGSLPSKIDTWNKMQKDLHRNLK